MKAKLPEYGLYVVVTEEFANGKKHSEILPALLDAGVKLIQLREKNLSKRELHEVAQYYRKETLKYKSCFIMNDHLDIAISVDADGIHLGQDDFPFEQVSRIWPDHILGISTHGIDEVRKAVSCNPGYINIGPIFDTNTKKHINGPVGVDLLKRALKETDTHITVMGGIKQENMEILLEAGARILAVVTSVLSSDNIYESAYKMQNGIESFWINKN